LCNNFDFTVSGKTGSHVRLSKITGNGKVGTVVPVHDELKPGTLRGVLRLAKVDIDDFYHFV
jgi:predicted RNA binding protein YcfA (HicA-like mRNA interferase family)